MAEAEPTDVPPVRVLDYQGPETYCDGTGTCATRPVALKTAKGFDSMTGLGSPGRNFIAELANGAIGYIPNRPAYVEGNYEPTSAR